ncbi:FxsA family protein [Nordella sp. HKS 07]|nr:FxsA family protein [Nordella sp. HKS 07]
MTIRHTGVKSLKEIAQASRSGQTGTDAALGGILGFFAGILFILPGLLSDAAAVLLLLPFVQRIIGRRFIRPGAQTRRGTVVIDGEAVEIIDERLPRPDQDNPSPWNR